MPKSPDLETGLGAHAHRRGAEAPSRRILLAHGAGAPSSSAWMQSLAKRLASAGEVVTFDYPYMAAGKRRPDPLARLLAAHRTALAETSRGHTGPIVLAGKSLGSRVGCHLALEVPVSALVCLGYPLRGKNGKLRDEVLLALAVPILFVQGTRDPLCPLALLEAVRERMVAPNELIVVDDGDHSLRASKTWLRRHNATQAASDRRAMSAIAAFLERHAPATRGESREDRRER